MYGPTDPRFAVQDGKLVVHPNRDPRLPYFYQVAKESHPLAKDRPAIQCVIVYVNDPSSTALANMHAIENTLKVPLGPDSSMPGLGRLLPLAPKIIYNIYL
jgi:hypothetical protein